MTSDAPASGSERRIADALGAADVGVWDWSVTTGELVWDETIARLHGVDPATFDGTMEAFLACVHPADRRTLEDAIAKSVEAGSSFLTEFRVVRLDGETRWIQGRGGAVVGPDGRTTRMVGLGMDTTELRSQREWAGRSVEFAIDGLVIIETDWTIRYVNPAAARLLRRSRADLEGTIIWEAFPEARGTAVWEELHHAAATMRATRFRAFYGPLEGWFELQVFPAPDGLTVFFRNVDDEVEAERRREQLLLELEATVERGGQLQETTASLAESLTVTDVARTVLVSTRRAFGTLYAGIALVDETGQHLEFEEQDGLPAETRREWGKVPLATNAPITVVIRDGKPLFHESGDELLREFPGLHSTMALVGQGAFANVPLMTVGRPFGVLSVSWPSPRDLSPDDRDFLTTVAAQCAHAIERARIYERERATARTLQAAIVPELFERFGEVRCAGRYLPAESGIEVGGDWYDAFRLPDSSLAIVIGDVAGHGLEAAKTMAQLRNMLRAYAFDNGSPKDVIERLDTILVDSGSEHFATCIYARFEPETCRLSFANAGHLPPVLLSPGAEPVPLATKPAPLLGAGGNAVEHSVRLEPDSRLVLFTDGLVERRTRPIDDGLGAVLDTLRTAPRDLDLLCDAVVASGGTDRREDDVCVLAVDFGGPTRPSRRLRLRR
jgi:PAS domain-containing protein